MGQILGSRAASGVGLKMNDKPTFETNKGFSSRRAPRKMIACEDDLKSARVPPQFRDYCAHLLMNYLVCRYKNMPFLYRCHHEKHAYLNCEHEDYVIRMKEFEREKRLREREKRLKEEETKK